MTNIRETQKGVEVEKNARKDEQLSVGKKKYNLEQVGQWKFVLFCQAFDLRPESFIPQRLHFVEERLYPGREHEEEHHYQDLGEGPHVQGKGRTEIPGKIKNLFEKLENKEEETIHRENINKITSDKPLHKKKDKNSMESMNFKF